MRNLLVVAVLVAVVLSAGCRQRDSITVTPDRQGHAYGTAGGTGGVGTQLVPAAGEIVYSIQKSDLDNNGKVKLSDIAQRFQMTLERLIERNDLGTDRKLKVGDTLIVNRR